jgi:hypothetical protein
MKEKVKKYNKLILIGNGFDLAMGLKTSYNDFLFWYLKKLLRTSSLSELQQSYFKEGTKYHFYKNELVEISCTRKYNNSLVEFVEKKKDYIDLVECWNKEDHFTINYKSDFFRTIIQSSITNWVDIEAIYYKILTDNLGRIETVRKLNDDFNIIKIELEEYLNTLDYSHIKTDKNNLLFTEQFFKGIANEEIIEVKQDDRISQDNSYFLNFNYTDSLDILLDNFKDDYVIKYQINHIHGKLFSNEEKMIFGFGDEMDENYKKIEELNDNIHFENIKSFKYFQSANYRNLMRFLNSNEYQVFVYGHSCGLSDRVMLNEIFENKNCKSIRIFYYNNENDFINKTMEISRHFKNNNSMRKKIVNFNPQDIIPQLKEKNKD